MRQETIEWLRHPYGRGKLLDDSEVSASAYLSKDSIAAENCVIRDATVVNGSRVTGSARVLGGTLITAFVGGNSSVSGKAHIRNAIIKDYAQVYDWAQIIGQSGLISIEGAASVYGHAVLEGAFRLYGKMRVNSGIWTRAPRYVDLGFESITESKLGAMVGCRDRTVEYWRRHGHKLAPRWGYSLEQADSMMRAVMAVQV